jgi:hypothetical protein
VFRKDASLTSIMSSNDFSDPKQGGDLSDMAPTGTRIPNDAGNMDTLPSVPRPGQGQDNTLGSATLDQAADNVNDVPRVSVLLRFFVSANPQSPLPISRLGATS